MAPVYRKKNSTLLESDTHPHCTNLVRNEIEVLPNL